MRFLCLHGIGTNSQIFQMQTGSSPQRTALLPWTHAEPSNTNTAALRYELGGDHSYEFVQGTVEWPMAPDLNDISDHSIPHYAYFGPSPKAVISALNDLDEYVKEEGPFDGIIGFSQGASLAVMYLVRWVHTHPAKAPPFACAILFSRIGAYDPVAWLEDGKVLKLERLPSGASPIQIPVAAIWGNEDWEEAKSQSSLTSKLFDETMVWTYVHVGSHAIPGYNAKRALKETARVIRRVIAQANMRSQ